MTNVLLHRSYKARKPGSILVVPQSEADSLETLGIGEILKEEQPAPKEKGRKEGAE
ncbi:hypothetical protein [Rhizobium leguminosarum]|uniref:hypothetical protein n=1 Tax=Rhizobium leguminosarum TaxID=384 RepID=UPI001C9288CA|nr:hypothetical protein [Rhizobium leguminosarum]MBY2986377.1 hypothetical protein [Rhizobium leguminosarum]